MTKFTRLLSAGAAFALVTSATFFMKPANPVIDVQKLESNACDGAQKAYLGATADRGFQNLNESMRHLTASINSDQTPAESKKAEVQHRIALKMNGISELKRTSDEVNVACGATVEQIIKYYKDKPANS